MNPIVINLFGAPGAGKSTGAAYIFSQLKKMGYNVELVTEFAKDLVWDNNTSCLEDQIYVFAEQNHRLIRLKDKVDIIITDSPLILSCFYNKRTDLLLFEEFVKEIFNSYNNFNYFVERVKDYNPNGRLQTEAESDQYAIEISDMLKSYHIPYSHILGIEDGYDEVIKDIINTIDFGDLTLDEDEEES